MVVNFWRLLGYCTHFIGGMADFATDIKLSAQLAGDYGSKVYVQVEENVKCTNDWNCECCN